MAFLFGSHLAIARSIGFSFSLLRVLAKTALRSEPSLGPLPFQGICGRTAHRMKPLGLVEPDLSELAQPVFTLRSSICTARCVAKCLLYGLPAGFIPLLLLLFQPSANKQFAPRIPGFMASRSRTVASPLFSRAAIRFSSIMIDVPLRFRTAQV